MTAGRLGERRNRRTATSICSGDSDMVPDRRRSAARNESTPGANNDTV